MSIEEQTTTTVSPPPPGGRRPPVPGWLLGLGPLVLIVVLMAVFALLNGPGLAKLSEGIPPKEEIAVEDVRFLPGQIQVTARNEGPDPVSIAQVNVSDYYAAFTQTRETMAPLETTTLTISYHWVDGDPYEIALVTSIGGKIPATVDAAALSPERGTSFFGLMTLLGIYVGVIPVALGMLWMPFIRRSSAAWIRLLLGVTVGLLAFLAVDAILEGMELVAGSGAFGGPLVVFLGASSRTWCSKAPMPGCGDTRTSAASENPPPCRHVGWPCSSPSASVCTTSAKGWPSAPRTPWDRWRSGPH